MQRKALRRNPKISKRKKRKKVSFRFLTILAFIVIIAVGMALMILKQPSQTQRFKMDPNEYFVFLDVSAFGYHPQNAPNIIRVKMMHFKMMPIGGDANNVVIFVEGIVNPANYYYPQIKNGTEQVVEIIFPNELQIRRGEKGYPVKIRIRADEAEGYVTIWLEEDMLLVP